MNTTISIKKDICYQAAKKAKAEGLSVSAVVRILLLDYADGKIEIGTRLGDNAIKVEPIEVDKKTQELMDNVISEWNKK
ncbi:MAG: hypothetical protein AAB373_00870 [Patescibacteria group bacterium]